VPATLALLYPAVPGRIAAQDRINPCRFSATRIRENRGIQGIPSEFMEMMESHKPEFQQDLRR
jgi:hypothetical protein